MTGFRGLICGAAECADLDLLDLRRGELPRPFFVCRACLTALGCNSPSHPDGGEVIAKRQGVVARRGLKAAWSKDASRWTRTGYEAYGAGRAGKGLRSPYPSRALVVNSAVAR